MEESATRPGFDRDRSLHAAARVLREQPQRDEDVHRSGPARWASHLARLREVKPPEFLGHTVFWLALSNLALALAVVYLFISNRNDIAQQRSDLEKICATAETIDLALVRPLLFETTRALADIPNGPQRVRIRQYRDNLLVAHDALSETRSCEAVR